MVAFERDSVPALYVASGKEIHWYAKPDNLSDDDPTKWWDKEKGRVPQPGGTITGLAATDNYLYALCMTDTNTRSMALKRISKSDNIWKTMQIDSDAASHPVLQSIYSAGDRLFIGSSSNFDREKAPSYAILHVAADSMKSLGKDLFYLNGAAFDGLDYYYLSANDMVDSVGGIYGISETRLAGTPSLSGDDLLPNIDTVNNSPVFKGIISLEDGGTPSTVLAMDRNGALYSVEQTVFTSLNKNWTNGDSMKFTGALALWRDKDDKPVLLLAGLASMVTGITSGYSNGYREFYLDWDVSGDFDYSKSSFNQPGDGKGAFTTVDDPDRYLTTIDKYCVNSMFQAPKSLDPEMTLFASTQLNGLWSYRKRDGVEQWNAEE
jgi:hypothetical protein